MIEWTKYYRLGTGDTICFVSISSYHICSEYIFSKQGFKEDVTFLDPTSLGPKLDSVFRYRQYFIELPIDLKSHEFLDGYHGFTTIDDNDINSSGSTGNNVGGIDPILQRSGCAGCKIATSNRWRNRNVCLQRKQLHCNAKTVM
jgi:hypothetical protein